MTPPTLHKKLENAMDIDSIKQVWAESDPRLAANLRFNAAALQAWHMRASGDALKRLVRELIVELAVNVLGVGLIGYFASQHVGEMKFLLPAIALDVYAVALVIAGARQLADARAIRYDAPVVEIQRKLEMLHVRRVRSILGTLLFAPLMWVPLLIVGARGFFGLDAYAAGIPWLAANAAFGVAVIPLAVWVARRYGPQSSAAPWMRELADTIAGRTLAEARDALAVIEGFAGYSSSTGSPDGGR